MRREHRFDRHLTGNLDGQGHRSKTRAPEKDLQSKDFLGKGGARYKAKKQVLTCFEPKDGATTRGDASHAYPKLNSKRVAF